ncbi:MAG: hypothetical protein JNM69_31215 [Archangium sp.]|nr:hypothetical protein [Archangium sp.]
MTTTKLGSVPTSPKLPSVSTRTTTPTATAAVAKALGVTSETSQAVTFDAAAQERAGVLNPAGQHIAKSADPGALWGEKPANPANAELRAAMLEFKKLSPDAQKAKIEELKTKQDALSKKMLARIETLDARYKQMRNVDKGEMLRNLGNKTDAMSPSEKQHLDTLLNKADGIAKQIEELKAKAATLPDSRTATPEQKEERTKLARQIKNARSRLSDATKAATTYVDSLGLKADRLAVNEQKIDPNAPAPSSSNSLLSMMAEWFHFDKVINFFTGVFTGLITFDELNMTPTQRETVRERRTEEANKELDRRLEVRREHEKRVDSTVSNRKQSEHVEEVDPRTQRQSLEAALRSLSKNDVPTGTARAR